MSYSKELKEFFVRIQKVKNQQASADKQRLVQKEEYENSKLEHIKAEEEKLENQKLEASLKLEYIEAKMLLEQENAEYKQSCDFLQELRKKKREVMQQKDNVAVLHTTAKTKLQKCHDEHKKTLDTLESLRVKLDNINKERLERKKNMEMKQNELTELNVTYNRLTTDMKNMNLMVMHSLNNPK